MKSLAVTYRPKTFNDVVGQDAVRKILTEQINTKTNKNCYLFCGGAGTGKTTCARIFANEINKGKGNPIEVDAASNNGVENVRQIIDQAKYKSMDSEYKVYIIDECHMLSTGAWNAMLKLIEEPPLKTLFLFCTTDPQKIPATILSRVQRYDFQRISMEGVIDRLAYIVEQENKRVCNELNNEVPPDIAEDILIYYEGEALKYIAKLADGGMRDAITLMDKCISYNNNLTVDNVMNALGTSNYDVMFALLEAIMNKKELECMQLVESTFYSGKDLKQFMKQFLYFVLDCSKIVLSKSFEFSSIPDTQQYRQHFNDSYTNENLAFILKNINRINNDVKWENSPKQLIQAELLILCQEY